MMMMRESLERMREGGFKSERGDGVEWEGLVVPK